MHCTEHHDEDFPARVCAWDFHALPRYVQQAFINPPTRDFNCMIDDAMRYGRPRLSRRDVAQHLGVREHTVVGYFARGWRLDALIAEIMPDDVALRLRDYAVKEQESRIASLIETGNEPPDLSWNGRTWRPAIRLKDFIIGAAIARRRRDLGLTRAALGARLGLSSLEVSRYERGAVAITPCRVTDFAMALQCSPRALDNSLPALVERSISTAQVRCY